MTQATNHVRTRRALGTRVLLAGAVAIAGTIAVSCKPDLGARESLVTRTMVLAVRSEPAEARPNTAVTYDLLVATPTGIVPTPLARWAFCATPKPLTENGAASAACLRDAVTPIADGARVVATIPATACATFGPEITSADIRPRDPDVTGGYYQPVRVEAAANEAEATAPTVALGQQRIFCRVANAGAEVATELQTRYRPNANPILGPIELRRNDGRVDAATGATVALGETVTFRATWPAESAEEYVVLDVVTQTVLPGRESLRASWFTTSGAFESDRTGRTDDDRATFTDNAWTAPDVPGRAHLFVVLRDARGGVAWTTFDVTVR